MTSSKLAWGLVAACAVGMGLLAGPSRPAVKQSGSVTISPIPRSVGSASCAGRACHGGLEPGHLKGAEYTAWIARDPHAGAYAVLATERSRRMLMNLGKARSIAEARPETEQLCLNCHGQLVWAGEARLADQGFGCENCHGPASRWLRPHTDRERWAALPVRKRKELGMQPLATLADRAGVCAGCHVGSAGREVNHDLIAAGHPRMNFEFDSYLANLPRHWRTDEGRDLSAAWAVGQAASAEAALRLLAHRADPEVNRPCPEFAEYDCFACHQEVRVSPKNRAGRVPGSVPWSEWYFAMPRLLGVEGLNRDLDVLSHEMGRPMPQRAAVHKEAKEAAGRLRTWLERHPNGPAKGLALPQLFPRMIHDEEIRWDVAAQMALALFAEYQARMKGKLDPEIDKSFAELFRQLRLSREGSAVLDSPRGFDARRVSELLRAISRRLAG